MQAGEQIVHLDETLPIKRGYHGALRNFWKRRYKQSDQNPVYKIRSGNYVELLSLGFAVGFNLPLKTRPDLESSVLLCNSEHPIILTAPNGTNYQHSE